MITEQDREYIRMACKLADENIDRGGGPFGAVIVRNGEVLATGCNSVTLDNDPTAHAEVNAIRNACRKVGNFKLEGSTIYTSCEPCPMCLSSLYWAGVDRIFYANTQHDAAEIDFDDKFIYDELDKPRSERFIPCVRIEDPQAIDHFRKWATKVDKIKY